MKTLLLLTWTMVACGGAKQPPPPEAPPMPPEQVFVPAAPGPAVSCLSGADCPSGVCEGEGCLESTPGMCVQEPRACTFDLRPYCGCDGKTFQASGSCPGARFEHKGPCDGDPLPPIPSIQPPAP